MKISIPPVVAPVASPTGKGKGQLAALAQLTTQMRVIQRDLQMPEEAKKKQIAMLREQTQAIQQAFTDKVESNKKSTLVESSSETADAAANSAHTGQQTGSVEATGEAKNTEAPQSSDASPRAVERSSTAPTGSATLGTIVDTFA